MQSFLNTFMPWQQRQQMNGGFFPSFLQQYGATQQMPGVSQMSMPFMARGAMPVATPTAMPAQQIQTQGLQLPMLNDPYGGISFAPGVGIAPIPGMPMQGPYPYAGMPQSQPMGYSASETQQPGLFEAAMNKIGLTKQTTTPLQDLRALMRDPSGTLNQWFSTGASTANAAPSSSFKMDWDSAINEVNEALKRISSFSAKPDVSSGVVEEAANAISGVGDAAEAVGDAASAAGDAVSTAGDAASTAGSTASSTAGSVVGGLGKLAGAAGTLYNLASTDWEDPESIGGTVGSTSGAIAGSYIPIPVLGTLLGSVIGKYLGSSIGGLFGDGEEEKMKKAKKEREMLNLVRNMTVLGSRIGVQNQQRKQGVARALS